MKKLILLVMASTLAAFGQATPSMTVAQINTAINSAAAGSTFTFAGGTYTINSPINIKCGITYQGPVVAIPTNGIPTNQTAILNNTQGTQGNVLVASNQSCTQTTTIQFFQINNAGFGIHVSAPFPNLVIQYNYVTSIPCDGGCTGNNTGGFWFDGPTQSAYLTNITVQWNQIGDANSCTAEFGIPNGGQCNGMGMYASVNGFYVLHNNFYHVGEGFHIFCPNYSGTSYPCEPAGSLGGSGGAITRNFQMYYNDFSNIHRIGLEEQPQESSGVDHRYNTMHDWNTPDYGSYGFSMACCSNGTHQQPWLNVTDNLVLFNTPSSNRYGYGMEAMGFNQTYSYNLIELGNWTQPNSPGGSPGISWGNGGVPQNGPYTYTYNYVCGIWGGVGAPVSIGNGAAYISSEGGGVPNDSYVPSLTGSIAAASCSGVQSAAPSISPAAGSQSFPLTVTLTDPGSPNGTAAARGNTGIWYTTDGSTPVPGSGTAKRVDSGGTFVLPAAATVKAVGMWGAANQPTSYPSGFGFTPSAAVSAAYTGSGLYISPTGSDSNPGTLASPWLTPNHAMTCGQTITAVSGTYSAANFGAGKWGTVSCPGANNVAWLICSAFDTCKISSASGDAVHIDKSFWGMVGWEASSTSSGFGACFTAAAATSGTNVHHIVFADNVANQCQGGGFTFYNLNTTTGVDYIAILGNIAYNAAQGATHCFSGISIYQPVASDANSGTHMYVAGNFSYANVNPATCNGTPSTDGEPVIIDTLDFSQGGGTPYTQQVVVQNNLGFFNGGRGFEVFNNQVGSTHAPVYLKYNTAYGDLTDNNQTNGCLGRSEIAPGYTKNTTMDFNLAQTRTGTSCSSGALYGSFAETVDATDTVPHGWYYSAAGHSTGIDNGGAFAFGTITTTNPNFTNPVNPGAPSCGSFASTAACMGPVITDYTPTASGATAYGRQPVSNTSVTDALFPAWLCTGTAILNPNIPQGLITPGCGVATGPPAATPVLSPTSASFYTTQAVAITDSTPSSTIYYTTNGTTPTTSSTVYTAPITVSATTTVQAIAAASGFSNSAIGSGIYTLINPPLTSCFQGNGAGAPGTGLNTMAVGATVQQIAWCAYSATGEQLACSPTADKYGDVITTWGVSNANIQIGAVGNAPGCASGQNGPGCVTGLAAGTANSTAVVGAHSCNAWTWTVTNSPPTLTGTTVTLQGGGSAVNVGSTIQACANMQYTGSINTQLCGTGTDAYGTVVSNFTSSTGSATIGSTTGLLLGVSVGTTNLSVTATNGSIIKTAPAFPVNVNAPINGVTFTGNGFGLQGGQIQ